MLSDNEQEFNNKLDTISASLLGILPPRDELLDEDELSFVNSSIPILPPPMPSLQLLHHAQLPFPATAPLACSTPRITTPLPLFKDFKSEGKRPAEELHRNKRGRESHSATEHISKKRKRNHKAVEKNIKAKELVMKRRQRQLKVVKKPAVIDVDKYQPKKPKREILDQGTNLLERDRDILLNPAGLLNDSIIDAAQKLLKQAFPALSGLQCVCCGLTMNFDIEPSEFVQVIHNGRGHWLTISMIGTSHPDVHVYNSMYHSVGTFVKAQTAALLHTESPAIRLQFMNVQMQAGGYDCGLFAVAFATALAFGEPPGRYHFAQEKMRHHLWSCFERRQISMFPYSKLRRATESTVKSVDEVPVYCICRMPEPPNTRWIECSGCKRWYHTESCVNVPSIALSTNTSTTDLYTKCVFCTAQLVYVYSCIYILSWSCTLCTDIIFKLLTC